MSKEQSALPEVQEKPADGVAPEVVEIVFPHTVTLFKPFDYGKERVEKVVLEHEPTAGDLVDIMNEKKNGDQALRMVSACTGWPDPKVKMLKARDFQAVLKIIQPFLGDGPETGN